MGVDLTHYFPIDVKDTADGQATKVWETWQRAALGLRLSPHQAFQALGVTEEVTWGPRTEPNNVVCWDDAVMHFPGSNDYNPSKPWVYKVCLEDG